VGRLLKEVRFDSGVLFTFAGQAIVIKVKRANHSDNSVKLIIEAAPEVRISDASGVTGVDPVLKNRQDG